MPSPPGSRDDGGVERDVFGFPVYPNEGGLARRLREARPEAQRSILDQLRALTPETMPERAEPTMTPEQAALMGIGMVPGIGDVAGVAADAYTFATDPESRTLGNAALAATGLLPFVPSGLGTVRRVLDDTTPVRRVAKKATTQAGRSANGTVAASEMGADAGGGLPMDEASRMQRAREMGFTEEAYRGSTADERRLRPASSGMWGKGVYAGSSPEAAEAYAYGDGGNIAPLLTRGPLATIDQWSDAVARHGWDGAQKALQREGYRGIRDDRLEDAVVLWDPKDARSRFAAFDPAKRDSSDLLASLAPAAVAGGALAALSPDDAAAMGLTPEEYAALMQYTAPR